MSDIITSLHLDKGTSHKILVAKELNGCDSSFITSCVLGHCIKIKSPVLVICSHNSKEHYQNVGLKMNYNLNKNIESGLIQFYNLGEELVNALLNDDIISCGTVINKLKKQIENMHETHSSVNVIFDGVSQLFDLEYSLRDVNYICKEIIDLIRSYDNSFLLFHCNAACENDETHVLANLLAYKCHVLIEVDHLASGLSADVSGHITFMYPTKKFEKEHVNKIDQKPSHHLFKLFDRGVKLLAPGAV
ncbi:uncharacterized protein LOC123715799 [Pieris brassicae]|uniref:uncharacterized protein LOC123715799 n=1 Tax=Pieris brassicae TaxID=7116 RepID=UPI001E65E2A1|nr:uncharacterized protein LOC123715799 [Pieris brassicae]